MVRRMVRRGRRDRSPPISGTVGNPREQRDRRLPATRCDGADAIPKLRVAGSIPVVRSLSASGLADSDPLASRFDALYCFDRHQVQAGSEEATSHG
jgi:hypothetical protein